MSVVGEDISCKEVAVNPSIYLVSPISRIHGVHPVTSFVYRLAAFVLPLE